MSTYKIEKLKGAENYQVWAFKVKRVLVDKLGSYNILSDDPPPQSDDPESEQGKQFILWTSNNEIAITVMTMTNQILHHVMNINFAREIWTHLENKYNRKDVYSTTSLRRSLHTQHKGNQSIQKHDKYKRYNYIQGQR